MTEQFITRSWCTPRSRIGASVHGSWRSRRYCRRIRNLGRATSNAVEQAIARALAGWDESR